MKKILVLAISLFTSLAFGAANDSIQQQRNSLDTGTLTRIVAIPAGGQDGLFFFNGTTVLPGFVTIGSGLHVNGSALEATATTGPQGPAGPAGPTGAQGPAGATGLTGAAGPQGDPGAAGATGPTGATGAAGATGVAGPAGPAGSQGATGAQGAQGNPGLAAFSMPVARTVAVSTSYQATDPSKPAIFTVSLACTNATTILASSACTVQPRMHTSAVTCSTGTALPTISVTVQLGLVFNGAQAQPLTMNLPAGAFFIICPTAGTFTVTAVEQSVN